MKLFAEKKQDAREALRENQRALRKTEREMDREALAMKRQEEQLIKEIKKAAKDGNTAVAKTLAKQLVRVRQQTTRTTVMKAQVKGISSGMSLAHSQANMVTSMQKAGQAMGAMNQQVDPVAMARILNEFSIENEKMMDKQEMMDDTLDGLFDDDDLEAEADNVTQQILDEIGIDQFGKMAKAKAGGVKVKEQAVAEEEEDDDLTARLAALRK